MWGERAWEQGPQCFSCSDTVAMNCLRADARTVTLRPNGHTPSIACWLVFPEHTYRPSEELTFPWARQENEAFTPTPANQPPLPLYLPMERGASVPTPLSPQEALRGSEAETGFYLDPGPLSRAELGHAPSFPCRSQSSHASALLFPLREEPTPTDVVLHAT